MVDRELAEYANARCAERLARHRKIMSVVEGTSRLASAPEAQNKAPQGQSRLINVCILAIGMAGVAAVTLGWATLLVRGATWLVWG
jgi:hypothetical protein